MRWKIATASVFLALILSGCETFGTYPDKLPPLSADLKICFSTTVPAPKPGPITKKDVIVLIAALKRSETSKTACGKRLLAVYEAYAS